MELYYKAVTRQRKILSGRVEAKDKSEAARYLRTHNIFPIKISSETEQLFSRFVPVSHHASSDDLIFFTRQLSSMLMSGLTLMQAITVLKNQVHDKYMAEILQGITSDIQDGDTFSQALSHYPKVFSSVYLSLIHAGEKSGVIDKVLSRLATNLEKSRDLKDTIRGALVYPIIVIILMVSVIGVLMFFVIPQLSTLYSGLNVKLPWTTQFVIGISHALISGLPIVVVCLIIGVFLYRKWRRTPLGRRIVDKTLLDIPLIGNLIRESILVEFTRTFSLLVSTGSLVVDSLHECAGTVDNVIYKGALIDVANRVEKGVLIGDAMAVNPLFPPLLVATVKIGEQTGKLDESLFRTSEYFEREVDQVIKALTTTIEPLTMVVLGVAVGFLIIAVITPIYGLITSIK